MKIIIGLAYVIIFSYYNHTRIPAVNLEFPVKSRDIIIYRCLCVYIPLDVQLNSKLENALRKVKHVAIYIMIIKFNNFFALTFLWFVKTFTLPRLYIYIIIKFNYNAVYT